MQKSEQTVVGRFADRLMLYAWDAVGLLLVAWLIYRIVSLVLGGL